MGTRLWRHVRSKLLTLPITTGDGRFIPLRVWDADRGTNGRTQRPVSVRQPKEPIAEHQILTGPQFNEAMRVLMVSSTRPGFWSLGLVGQQTQRFRQVTLTADDIARLTVTDPAPSFDGDGHRLRLGLRAHALGIAHEFDPYFGQGRAGEMSA